MLGGSLLDLQFPCEIVRKDNLSCPFFFRDACNGKRSNMTDGANQMHHESRSRRTMVRVSHARNSWRQCCRFERKFEGECWRQETSLWRRVASSARSDKKRSTTTKVSRRACLTLIMKELSAERSWWCLSKTSARSIGTHWRLAFERVDRQETLMESQGKCVSIEQVDSFEQ